MCTAFVLRQVIFFISTKNMASVSKRKHILAFVEGRRLQCCTKHIRALFVLLGCSSNLKLGRHHRVNCFALLALASCDPVKVNAWLSLDNRTRNQKILLLVSEEVRHDPWFLLPFVQSLADDELHLVGWALFLRVFIIFRLEDELKEEAKQLAGVFDVRVHEDVKRQVVKVIQCLQILDKLLTALVPVGSLLQVLFLQETHVNEIFLLI